MFDHRSKPWIVAYHGAARPERVPTVPQSPDKTERSRGLEKSRRPSRFEPDGLGKILRSARAGMQAIENPQTHACEQHLRIDETCAQVEDRARFAPREGTQNRQGAGDAPETRISDELHGPGAQALRDAVGEDPQVRGTGSGDERHAALNSTFLGSSLVARLAI
jgi:hypothetical protein